MEDRAAETRERDWPEIRVCHFPPGTSKWNQIEHRLFCHISQNWRGSLLVSYQVIINSIAATTTSTGLKVYARLDQRDYPKKVEVTDAQLAAVNSPDHSTPNGTTRSPNPVTGNTVGARLSAGGGVRRGTAGGGVSHPELNPGAGCTAA